MYALNLHEESTLSSPRHSVPPISKVAHTKPEDGIAVDVNLSRKSPLLLEHSRFVQYSEAIDRALALLYPPPPPSHPARAPSPLTSA